MKVWEKNIYFNSLLGNWEGKKNISCIYLLWLIKVFFFLKLGGGVKCLYYIGIVSVLR